MADMTMCNQESCNKKNNCWRYLATPNPLWQAYFSPKLRPDGSCLYYWPLDLDDLSSEED